MNIVARNPSDLSVGGIATFLLARYSCKFIKGIFIQIAGCSSERAHELLIQTNYDVKVALLMELKNLNIDDALCVEVAFNHGEAIAWNLLKSVLACELNHVQKAVQGQIGIYICATDKMKKAANIDSASGSFEKVLRYLPPMMNQLTVPIMVIGLEPFETFYVNKESKEIVRI